MSVAAPVVVLARRLYRELDVTHPAQEAHMKNIAAITLMLTFGVASAYAHQKTVKMTFSGTSGASAIDLQYPGAHTGEDNFAGDGTLGRFTYHDATAEEGSPSSSSTCSGPSQLYFLRLAGAAVLRFEDGSLLKITLTEGADCIDLAAQQAHCTMTFKVTGGTGRFKNASGTLTLTESVVPVLAGFSHAPVFFASTGEITGTILGVARDDDDDDRDGRH